MDDAMARARIQTLRDAGVGTGSVITETIFISAWHCEHSSGSSRLRQCFCVAGFEHLAQQARPALAQPASESRLVLRIGGVVQVRRKA